MTVSPNKSCSRPVFDYRPELPVTANPAQCSQVRDHSVITKAVRWGRLALLTLALSLTASVIYTIALVASATGN